MSRVAKQPVLIPSGVEVKMDQGAIKVKGPKGELQYVLHTLVAMDQQEKKLQFSPKNSSRQARAMAGTVRSLVHNMVTGVHGGFEKKLLLKGVGYKGQVQGDKLTLSLGFSHPVIFLLPKGVTAEMLENTVIVLKSIDRQLLGQVAANIRAYRPPEPYKGKGIRYADEIVVIKESSKKK